MIALWKTLKDAEAQAQAIYTAAETAYEAALAAKQANPAAPNPVHPTDVIAALPALRSAIGSVEFTMGNAAVASARQQLADTLTAALAAPAAPPSGVS